MCGNCEHFAHVSAVSGMRINTKYQVLQVANTDVVEICVGGCEEEFESDDDEYFAIFLFVVPTCVNLSGYPLNCSLYSFDSEFVDVECMRQF